MGSTDYIGFDVMVWVQEWEDKECLWSEKPLSVYFNHVYLFPDFFSLIDIQFLFIISFLFLFHLSCLWSLDKAVGVVADFMLHAASGVLPCVTTMIAIIAFL